MHAVFCNDVCILVQLFALTTCYVQQFAQKVLDKNPPTFTENLKEPFAADDEVMEQFYKVVDAIEMLVPDDNPRPPYVTSAWVRETLEKNRLNSPRYKELIAQWWETHPEKKAELEAAIAAEESKLTEARSAHDGYLKQLSELESARNEEAIPYKASAEKIEGEIGEAKKELSETSFFKFSRKKEIRAQIESSRQALAKEEAAIKEICDRYESEISDAKKNAAAQESQQKSVEQTIASIKNQIEWPELDKDWLKEQKA